MRLPARGKHPAALKVPQIVAIVQARSGEGGGGVAASVLATFLNCLDGVDGGGGGGVLVVAATNRPHVLDDALLRPGRFGVAICVLEPNRAERGRILRHYSAELPLASDVELDALADRTDGASGAVLEALCREAVMLALREDLHVAAVGARHFEAALQAIHRSAAP